jgi:hypothetical protein
MAVDVLGIWWGWIAMGRLLVFPCERLSWYEGPEGQAKKKGKKSHSLIYRGAPEHFTRGSNLHSHQLHSASSYWRSVSIQFPCVYLVRRTLEEDILAYRNLDLYSRQFHCKLGLLCAAELAAFLLERGKATSALGFFSSFLLSFLYSAGQLGVGV